MTDTETTVPLPAEGLIRDWVDFFGENSESPLEAHLASALALVSAAIGWRVGLSWRMGSAESCNLSVILAGQSALARKSTTLEVVGGLIREAYNGDVRAPRDRPLRAQSIGHLSNRGLFELLAAKDAEEARKWQQEPPPSVLAIFDEFGSYIGDQRGGRDGPSYIDSVRKALMDMSRGKLSGAKTGTLEVHETRVAISILAAMTSDELRDKISPGIIKSGFLGRFIVIPLSKAQRYHAFPSDFEMSETQFKLMAKWIRFLAEIPVIENGMEYVRYWEHDAYLYHKEWYEMNREWYERTAEQDPNETNEAVEAMFGRMATAACKIAICLSLTREWNPDPKSVRLKVTLDDIKYGHHLAERTIENVREMLAYATKHRKDKYADKVIEFLRKREFDYTDAGKYNELRAGQPLGRWAKQKEINDHVRDSMDAATRWNIIQSMHGVYVDVAHYEARGQRSLMVRLLPESDPLSPVHDGEIGTQP